MKKLLSLLGVGIFAAMWSGCGITDPVSAPRITVDAIGSIAITSNDVEKWVIGKIEADTAIESITATVETAAGVAVPLSQIAITTAAGNKEKTQNLTITSGIKLTIKSAAQSGNYKLKITVEAGVTGSGEFDFELTGNAGTALTEATATLGNTLNTEPGSIDLDNGSRYTSLEVTSSNAGSIDLCFANGSSIDRFYVPEAAKYGTTDNKTIKTTAAGFNFTDTWPLTGYASAVRINTITSAQYDATTTAQAAAALWDAGNALVFAPVTAVDNAYLVKTSSGAYVLVKVTALVAGTSGTVSFKYAK